MTHRKTDKHYPVPACPMVPNGIGIRGDSVRSSPGMSAMRTRVAYRRAHDDMRTIEVARPAFRTGGPHEPVGASLTCLKAFTRGEVALDFHQPRSRTGDRQARRLPARRVASRRASLPRAPAGRIVAAGEILVSTPAGRCSIAARPRLPLRPCGDRRRRHDGDIALARHAAVKRSAGERAAPSRLSPTLFAASMPTCTTWGV